ncbi:hypothetical protein JCM11641_000173 [Rhodosporidiobolus odoratus]
MRLSPVRTLALTSAALFQSCNAAILSQRQLVNTLSISFGSSEAVYVSAANFSCAPYPISVDGLNPPFELVAVEVPYDPDNLFSQHVHGIGNVSERRTVEWLPDLPVGEHFAVRVKDAVGNVQYSPERWIEAGAEDQGMICRKNSNTTGMTASELGAVVGGCVLVGVCVLFGLGLFCCCHFRPKDQADGGEGELDIETAQTSLEGEKAGSTAMARTASAKEFKGQVAVLPVLSATGGAPPPAYHTTES